jgi:DNA-binding MarR family transcriptional regulator
VTTKKSVDDAARVFAELFPAVYLRYHRRDAKRSALTGASHAVMLHLAQTGPLSIGECARHLGRAQSVVTEIVSGLERHGLLARVPDANDRRRTEVWLTDAGRARLEREHEVLERSLVERAFAKMSEAERTALIAGTRALVAAAETDSPITKKPERKRRAR